MEAVTTITKYEKKLDTILGLGNDNRETLLNYIQYVTLKKDQGISDIGNYNVYLAIKDGFNYTKKVIDLIFQVLKDNGIMTDDTYTLITKNEIRRNFIKTDSNVVLINEDTGIYLRGYQANLKQIIYNNPDKIFILLNKFPDKNFLDKRLESYLGECFSFDLCIEGKLNEKEKQIYIQNRLKANNIKVSSRCDFVKILAKNDTTVIDKELLYLTIKCRANHKNTIDDKLLENINRKQYIKQDTHKTLVELDNVIGQEKVISEIHDIVNYIKLCKSRNSPLPSLHFVFKGNPRCL